MLAVTRISNIYLNSGPQTRQRLYLGGLNIEDEEITNADAVPSIISALTTSIYSQKLSEKFGYDNVLEVNYDDYTFDGKTFSERIGDEHKTCRVIVKRLDS